jgi:hypothetical protein
MNRVFLPVAILALPLAACDRGDNGTSISINGNSAGASVDGKSGEVKIDTPVFKGSFNLPKMNLTADNFDINGVHLYPGSRIADMNINARGEGDGIVSVKFDSPATPATVRDWFMKEFEKAGVKVSADGNGLKGTTDDKPFRIDLTPQDERAAGTVTIG